MRVTGIRVRSVLASGALAFGTAMLPAQAQTTYMIPSLSDFSGPFSTVMPSIGGSREAVINWWNAEVGTKQGIKLQMKAYDTRFETAQTASLWPGILAEKPLVGFALAGPDTAALQQRLPSDKVVMFSASASNGFAWRPDQWILTIRPTFAHEFVGFIDWFHKTKGEGRRPVKVALVSSEASPSFVDVAKGVQAYAKANPQVVELVETVYAEVQPADLTLQMRRVTNAGAEAILAPASIQQAIAIKRALSALNRKVPVVFAMHNAPSFIAKPMGGMQTMEGDYETQGGPLSTEDDTPVKRFYDTLVSKYGLKAPWNGVTIGGIAQSLLLVRAVEAAGKKYGADKLTGDLVHKTLLETTFTSQDLFGYARDLKYEASAPFPVSDIRVNIGVVKDGKLVEAAHAHAVPKMDRW